MSVETLLAAGRRAAEALMVDRCIVREITGTTLDPVTFEEVPTYNVVYDDPSAPGAGGPCRFKTIANPNSNPSDDEVAGEQQVTVSAILLQLPVSAAGISAGMEVIPVSSLDVDAVGRVLRVDGPFMQTHSTMRRFLVEEAS